MIKLQEVKEAYEELSGKASDVARQLAFAGIGIIWIFNKGAEVVGFREAGSGAVGESALRSGVEMVTQSDAAAFNIPEGLTTALLLLCLALAVDLVQYVFSTGIWYVIYLLKHEKGVADDASSAEVKDSEWINVLPWLFWLGKIGLTIWAYVLIAKFLFLI